MNKLWLTLLIIASGCATLQKPTDSIDNVSFSVSPHIINREGRFYLKYRMKLSDTPIKNLRRVIQCKVVGQKAYYYFEGVLSFPDWGNTVEHPLEYDGITEFAKRNEVYWLNEDMSELKLEIQTVSD